MYIYIVSSSQKNSKDSKCKFDFVSDTCEYLGFPFHRTSSEYMDDISYHSSITWALRWISQSHYLKNITTLRRCSSVHYHSSKHTSRKTQIKCRSNGVDATNNRKTFTYTTSWYRATTYIYIYIYI
jgi:hypothetical protein